MGSSSKILIRHVADERISHWLTALSFFLAMFSGLAFYYPSLYWMASLMGGGPWSRILHPFFGMVMLLTFLYQVVRLWKDNRMTRADWKWLANAGSVMMKHESNVPEQGRFNGGQKMLFKLLLLSMLLLLASGIVMWRPYFAHQFEIDVVRWALMVHAVSAFVLCGLVLGHIYMVIWTRGSMWAITRGTVTKAWARHHHPAWYREMTGSSE
jgi:formate dehydrogenase subunit gamma